jgi:RNA polymerase sigma-70 factor (ECF subfamily)
LNETASDHREPETASDYREQLTALIPQLRGFARSLTGGDRELADDLVQDSLVKSMQAEAQFAPGTNLRAWLFTILRNTFLSHVGRKRFKVEVHDEDLERLAWTAAPQDGRLEALAFRRAFRQLSAAHREVLVLSILQGHSYEAIAVICGCEIGTVKSRVNRARAQLKAMLVDGELPVQPRASTRASASPPMPTSASPDAVIAERRAGPKPEPAATSVLH